MEALGVRFGELPVSPFLERVYRDEIRHVAHGLRWFRRWKEPEESDWDAFVRELEVPLSPARARGRVLDREGRRQAGLDEDFVQRLEVFSRSRGRPPWVYSFNPGVEDEAAGRVPSKAARTLRRDLAALPHVLAGADDIVLAPPQRPEFLLGLKEAGFALPEFRQEPPGDRAVAGARPFGVPGEHLRRSRIATLRDDVALCRSMTDVREATLRMGRVVLKSEFSSSGRGIRWGWDAQAERWAEKRLQQDGVVLVEPWLDIVVELSGLFWEGRWQGLSQPIVEGGRWCGHWLGALLWGLPRELHRFVFEGRRVEKVLRALDLPETCGVDVAVVRSEEGLALRLLELNARTTMGHYALALKKQVPTHRYFRFVRLSELAHLDAIHLTDPEMASTWCAVLER